MVRYRFIDPEIDHSCDEKKVARAVEFEFLPPRFQFVLECFDFGHKYSFDGADRKNKFGCASNQAHQQTRSNQMCRPRLNGSGHSV
jgi:hypothetical protein